MSQDMKLLKCLFVIVCLTGCAPASTPAPQVSEPTPAPTPEVFSHEHFEITIPQGFDGLPPGASTETTWKLLVRVPVSLQGSEIKIKESLDGTTLDKMVLAWSIASSKDKSSVVDAQVGGVAGKLCTSEETTGAGVIYLSTTYYVEHTGTLYDMSLFQRKDGSEERGLKALSDIVASWRWK